MPKVLTSIGRAKLMLAANTPAMIKVMAPPKPCFDAHAGCDGLIEVEEAKADRAGDRIKGRTIPIGSTVVNFILALKPEGANRSDLVFSMGPDNLDRWWGKVTPISRPDIAPCDLSQTAIRCPPCT